MIWGFSHIFGSTLLKKQQSITWAVQKEGGDLLAWLIEMDFFFEISSDEKIVTLW